MYLFAPVKNKKGKTTGYKLVVGPKTTREEILDSKYVKRQRQRRASSRRATKLLAVPRTWRSSRCGEASGSARTSGRAEARPTTTSSSTTRGTRSKPIPEMTGSDLNLKGTRQDFDTQGLTGQADRPHGLHEQAARRSSTTSRRRSPSRGRVRLDAGGQPERPGGQLRAAVRDRPRPRDQVGADRQLPRQPERHPGQQRRGDHRDRLDQGGEGPRARPPDRRAAVQLPPAREDRDLGDARQGLAGRRRRRRRSAACSSSRSSC